MLGPEGNGHSSEGGAGEGTAGLQEGQQNGHNKKEEEEKLRSSVSMHLARAALL